MLTVVVPAHNAIDHLAVQLAALVIQDCTWPWELLVVDHKSDDGTGALAESMLAGVPNARVVRLDTGHGVGTARNWGAQLAAGNALAFCDADDLVRPGWVQVMSDALSHHALVAGRLEYASLNVGVPYRPAHQSERPITFFGAPTIISANFGCTRSAWDALGGFDERLGGGEDIDFGLRAWEELGLTPHFAERAVISYRYRLAGRSIWSQGKHYGQWAPAVMKRHIDSLPRRPKRAKLMAARVLKVAQGLIRASYRWDARPAAIFRLAVAYGRIRGSWEERYFYI